MSGPNLVETEQSRYLERSMPHLIKESKKEFEEFKDQVTRFDLGLAYDGTRIQHIYETLILKWVKIGQKAGGAFLIGNLH